MNDLLIPAAAQLASIVAGVWVLTEIIGNSTHWRKDLIALVLGPALAIGGYVFGFVTAIPVTVPAWKGYGGAAFAGLIATLTAKAFHDYLLTPYLAHREGPPGPPTPPLGRTT